MAQLLVTESALRIALNFLLVMWHIHASSVECSYNI